MCPKCKSEETDVMTKFLMFGMVSILFFLTSVIGILFPIIWIATAGLLIAIPITFFIPKFNYCKKCGETWKYEKNRRA